MRLRLLHVLYLLPVLSGVAFAAQWSWQEPHAQVLPSGDLEWMPKPFVFQKGASARYIDYETGRDSNDGLSTQTPWKHHPWDHNARGQAAICEGIHTYIFKRGVAYRGALVADESGQPGNPIRMTSDPAWGRGEAVICGSETVTGWTMGSDHPDIPNALEVAHAELDFAPRNVWLVEDDGTIVRIPLARTPNWKVSDPDDLKSEWWSWDNPEKQWGSRETLNGVESHIAFDTKHLTGLPEYYKDAYVWTEYGWVMGTPYPTRVLKYYPSRHALVFGGQWSDQAGQYHIPRHARYYLEDKPHYLDQAGEFWFEKKGAGGTLHLRLPDDRDPTKARVEAARHLNLIDSKGMSHVHITGLAFRFTNVYWALDASRMENEDVTPACVRLLGSGKDLVVANCLFEHIHMAVRMMAIGDEDAIDGVVVRDNTIQYTDHGAVLMQDSGQWGMEYPNGRLYDVKILRNKLFEVGRRPNRFGQGPAIDLICPQTVEIAGNIGHRLYGSGITVFGGKRTSAKTDRPLTRILIHHNKIADSLLNNNDFGGIETWQGGPAYVFDNISANPRGFRPWGFQLQPNSQMGSNFAHAYYMDGGFKQYYFNNIAWGKSRDPLDPLSNCSAFQEIHGYLAAVFNNTVHNFVIGSRRQAAEAGRNRYLGNIWHSIGGMVFRHGPPAKTAPDPNAADAGPAKSSYSHESNAYDCNVFYNVPECIGVFEPDGKWHMSVESFRDALAARGSIGALGELVEESPLAAAEKHDFRPTRVARDKGARVFVPWGLYATVGEWPFYTAGNDPTRIMDEHFYLAPYYVERQDYRKQPMYPLKAVNIGADDYEIGPLEDWTPGALRLNGRDQYAVLPAEAMASSVLGEEIALENETFDWIAFDAPEHTTPGKPLEVKMHLKGVDPSLKLRADLHWGTTDDYGGFNARGGDPQEITGDGPHKFTFTPEDKPGLAVFTVTVWTSPTGGWEDRVHIARHRVGKTADVPDSGFRTPAVNRSNFLVEACFKTAPSHFGGILIEKMEDAGYSLIIGRTGGATFLLKSNRQSAEVSSSVRVNDGRWHHVVAECDRSARIVTLYIDGEKNASAAGPGPDDSLLNAADLYVGGTPDGRCLDGTFEFLRIALGTLADSKTTIEELYAWQFNGPFLRDFCGNAPVGKRDAGAIEFTGP